MTPDEYDAELAALNIRAAEGEDVRDEAKRLMRAFVAGMAAWLAAQVPLAWVQGAEIVPGALSAVHTESAYLLADVALERYRQCYDVAVRKVSDTYARAALLKNLDDGGRSWKAYARGVRESMQSRGATVFRDSMGREWSLKHYSEMVARTTLQQAKNEAARMRLVEKGYDLAVITGPVPGERPACAHYAGMTVSLTGRTPGYPTLSDYTGAGGFGPNCRHGIAKA
jgi:hypothetical protein